jgi:hypothetical protein
MPGMGASTLIIEHREIFHGVSHQRRPMSLLPGKDARDHRVDSMAVLTLRKRLLAATTASANPTEVRPIVPAVGAEELTY